MVEVLSCRTTVQLVSESWYLLCCVRLREAHCSDNSVAVVALYSALAVLDVS
jgi:hypothetical protein